MESRSDFAPKPYISLTSLMIVLLLKSSSMIGPALSTKMRDVKDVGLNNWFVKLGFDPCGGRVPVVKACSMLSKSKFTSRSCSEDFECITSFSSLMYSPSQKVVLRSSFARSRRLRVSENNCMFPFKSSIWFVLSLESQLLSVEAFGKFGDSNTRFFFGLPRFFCFTWGFFSLPSSAVQIFGKSSSLKTAISWRSHWSKFVRRAVECPFVSFLYGMWTLYLPFGLGASEWSGFGSVHL